MQNNPRFPLVSIVIPVEEFNNYLAEVLPMYSDLDYPNYEVIVFTTKPCTESFNKVRFITLPDSAKNPAKKRDMALKYSRGDWFAFIDDDAFPSAGWLREASTYFNDIDIAAVCGPGLTPPRAGILEKASGCVSASRVGGGTCTYRFLPEEKRYVDDFPSMNLIIRKESFEKVNGFDSNFYPGEDTKLCLDITHKLSKKIMYDPKVLVYHHRRPLFKKHLIQNGRYGFHRGYFAKKLPQTSFRLTYFIPTIFTLGLLLGPVFCWSLGFINVHIAIEVFRIYLLFVTCYFVLLAVTSFLVYKKEKNVAIALLVIPGIFSTHVWYGIKFIQGLFAKKLDH